MPIRRPLSRAALATLAAVAGCCERPAPAGPSPAPPAPRLVVMIVVDQLPTWGFEARRPLYRHGLARLLDEGTYYRRAEYPYAITYTGPGHATLATGATPRVHRVIANGWYRRAQGRDRAAEWDPDAHLLPLPGREPPDRDGASGRGLAVEGIADRLRAAGGGRSVVVAGKSRAACLVAGQRPDVALWYEAGLTGMTSSTSYADALPAWALALDRDHPVAPYLTRTWTASDPAALARATGQPDDSPGEGAEYDLGVVFPHDLAASSAPAKALRATPFLDTIEIDAALAAVDGEQLGADDRADLLVVSFSAHDYAGHNWGQESWELLELELAFDRELGRLLDGLDARVGRDRYAVVLTSDHGATPLIERGRHPGARRIRPDELEGVSEAAAAGVLGPGDWIAAVSSGMVYASPALLVRPAGERDAALAAIGAALVDVPRVARAIRLDDLPADCAGLDRTATQACLSYAPGESGEILIVPEDGSLITTYDTGTSHDAISDDNQYVPLIVRAPGWPHRRIDEPVSILAVAPTVAALLSIPPPSAARAAALRPPD